MSLNFNNGVANVYKTPGMWTDLFANRPPANVVAIGTIFVSSDTGDMYQSDGTSWYQIGGGGGGSQNLQQVVNVGNIINDGTPMFITNPTLNYFATLSPNAFDILENGTSIGTTMSWNGLFGREIVGVVNNKMDLRWLGGMAGFVFNIDYNGSFLGEFGIKADINNDVLLGDFQNLVKGFYLKIDNQFNEIKTYTNNAPFGLAIVNSQAVYLGEFNGNPGGNNTFFYVDDFFRQMQARFGGNGAFGLDLDYANNFCKYGDANNLININSNGLVFDCANLVTQFTYGNLWEGMQLDYGSSNYKFGSNNATLSGTSYIEFDLTNKFITTYDGTDINGIKIDQNNLEYQFFYNGSGTRFGLDVGAQKLTASSDLLVGTSGPVSGQHLKIVVGGVDYVIELKNP